MNEGFSPLGFVISASSFADVDFKPSDAVGHMARAKV